MRPTTRDGGVFVVGRAHGDRGDHGDHGVHGDHGGHGGRGCGIGVVEIFRGFAETVVHAMSVIAPWIMSRGRGGLIGNLSTVTGNGDDDA